MDSIIARGQDLSNGKDVFVFSIMLTLCFKPLFEFVVPRSSLLIWFNLGLLFVIYDGKVFRMRSFDFFTLVTPKL